MVDDTLLEAIEEVAAASSTFLTGDPEPFKALWSHADDVTIFGGYGRSRRGWAEVARRLEWASARFRAGSATYESLAAGSSRGAGLSRWASNADGSPWSVTTSRATSHSGSPTCSVARADAGG